ECEPEWITSVCVHCECPDPSHIREQNVCVEDLGCNWGVANLETGLCWPDDCPYGDGLEADCYPEQQCVPEEFAILYFEPEAEFSTQCVCDEAAGFVWSENLGSCINCDSYRDTEEYISPMEAACANVPKCVYDVNDPVMNTYGYSTDVYHSTGEYNTVCESIGIEQAFPYASFGDVDYYDGLNMGGL